LSRAKANYPNLEEAFSSLQSLIEPDIESRNVATHETFLILGLMRDDFSEVWEVDDVPYSHDPQSEDGLRIQKMVRKTLRKFVTEDKKHIQEIADAASKFYRLCDEPIRNKHW